MNVKDRIIVNDDEMSKVDTALNVIQDLEILYDNAGDGDKVNKLGEVMDILLDIVNKEQKPILTPEVIENKLTEAIDDIFLEYQSAYKVTGDIQPLDSILLNEDVTKLSIAICKIIKMQIGAIKTESEV